MRHHKYMVYLILRHHKYMVYLVLLCKTKQKKKNEIIHGVFKIETGLDSGVKIFSLTYFLGGEIGS